MAKLSTAIPFKPYEDDHDEIVKMSADGMPQSVIIRTLVHEALQARKGSGTVRVPVLTIEKKEGEG